MSSNGTVTAHPYKKCTAVTDTCPVTATTQGYYPNLGINYFFAIGFGIAAVSLVVTGIWKRTWGYSGFLAAGAALELAGYAARIPLHANPWDQQAFETQICAIILAPTLICIGLYLTLKHACLALCPQLSRVRPTLYPWIFVPADVSCLLVQAIGGALAASAGYTSTTLLSTGNHAIIAGIALQVVVLAFFGIASLDYYVHVHRLINGRDRHGLQPTPAALELWTNRDFRMFSRAAAAAYVCILIRCIYRIAEMAGGWGNKIMQDQPSFIVLEGFMILIAVCLLAAFPPGFLFPQMAMGRKKRRAAAQENDAPIVHTKAEKKNATAEAQRSDNLEAGTAYTPSEALHEK
ncbi:rta1 domain protein [Grosmannia clavigera kw1407]|uniref:Rta1 domain protein n=1 Tax=Grosmannia clavigera (strain kw1407 / UAMH 11150) TaxID=655863 RepID=F0X8E1_GROCL|nr:rta1 domain protein [Grosmannia clavigera kw1407]EFX05844.1 rta1 domain protein [Grosmannia clavigera kw1407]